ncbi:MAG: HAMP domain-containing sensor histidine kinase, partial [Bacteroidota bacterium]
ETKYLEAVVVVQIIASGKEEVDLLRDTIAESSLDQLVAKIRLDEEFPERIVKPYPFKLDKEDIQQQVNLFFTRSNYLYNNYSFKVFGFDKYNDPIIKHQLEQLDLFEDKFKVSKNVRGQGLQLYPSTIKGPVYLADFIISPRNSPDNPLRLILQFERNRKDKSRVYTELLVDQPYKQLQELDKYDYAIYQNGQLIDSKGGVYGQKLNVSPLPEVDQSNEIIIGKRSELICRVSEDKTVVIGKEKELFIKAISLFSYIFGMLVLLILVFALINTFVGILPKALSFSLKGRPSLRNRIQLSVIFLIVTSFFIIGMVTVWFFRTSSEDYHEKRLERKTSAVLRNAIHDVESQAAKDSTFDIRQLVTPLTRIHRIDINMYDTKGNLISTSEDDIYKRGIITARMAPLAYRALHLTGAAEYVNDREQVGELRYKSAYVPLKVKTEAGERTLAYLGLPYYSEHSSQRSDITIFMSTLLNVYVFLLLIAGAIAIAVANSITKPLAKIGDKLKQVKLGKRNEKLEWKSQDELGELIAEYNRMINKLEESADRLAQSEREGAWREMAKQVAHEIKNPLTPMKLSIQYLQHAYRSNPDDIEPLLKRVAGTLIEQIDNLAQIASEFSNFAKMPRAENQKILLNQLVHSVFDLFSNEQYDMDLQLNISLPDEQYFVYADRNHLMRVLNNLIKNAIQAIPDERSGVVKVFLYRRDNQAIIKVSDNGSGISDDKKDKVFVPNFTTKNSGTGLGLAISKNIIESVNGEIFFETIVDVGTDFFVILPLVEVTQLVN